MDNENSYLGSSSISSEKLRRAIERNRAKREKKSKWRSAQAPNESSNLNNSPFDYQSQLAKKRPQSNAFERSMRSKNSFEVEWGSLFRINFFKQKLSSILNIKITELFIVMAWVFNGFLLLRLIFVDNGVLDYYRMEKVLADKKVKIKNFIKDNKLLREEIKKIKTNRAYQKRLAKENLGVIEKDEYLVVFSRDSKD